MGLELRNFHIAAPPPVAVPGTGQVRWYLCLAAGGTRCYYARARASWRGFPAAAAAVAHFDHSLLGRGVRLSAPCLLCRRTI